MERIDIIDAVGREYHTANIENGEFSYPKAFKEKNLDFEPIYKKKGSGSWQFLDIRFELDGVSLLIETKNDADKWPTVEEQIAAYVEYEKRLTGNKIIAMVANTSDDRITVWKSEVEDDRKLDTEEAIRTMSEYVSMFDAKHTNNKEEVMRNTYQLNELLHRHGVGEKLRSQFVGTCLAVLLPMACAIGNSTLMKQMKNAILKNNTLDAVFSLPDDIFYPGASACACCMVFDVGTPHKSANRETFFAYCKDDGFKKRKNLGRVEQMDENGNSLWATIEKKWIDTYKNRDVIPGFSARHMVTGDDEWLCEAYMETDYTTLTEEDFQQTVNDYLAYLVKTGAVYED